MGAKIPGRLKTRRTTCKCDVCGCGFLNIQALRSHQACVHPRTTKRVAYKPKIEVIARRKLLPLKKVKTGNMKAKVVNSPVEKTQSVVKKSEDGKPYNTRRTEFECPVCSKIFTVYFSAYRHIQKHHCINEEGEAVVPNSSDLIQPTRIELCTSCNKRVASNQSHTCASAIDEKSRTNYTCLGCEQTFTSLHMFEMHIPGLHCDEAEKFSFPDMTTFTAWKEDMESQTELKYVMLNNKGHSQTYHCNNMTTEGKMSRFCPSSFTIQELSKSILVAFFHEHHGHVSKEYKKPDMYKKFVVSDKCDSFTVPKTKDCNEVYAEFKKLMNNIVSSSEKTDVNGLKILLGKALEMMSILKKYNEPVPVVDANKSITDDEITKLLDKPLRKRKVEIVTPSEDSIAKRLRKDKESVSEKPEAEPILEDFKPQSKEIKTYSNPKKLNPLKVEENKKPEMHSPSSFNDSYKNFVDASYKISVDKIKVKTKEETKKKEIVKTKVGQFKPNLSPKENVKPNLCKDNIIKPNILSKNSVKEVKITKEFKFPKFKPDLEYEVMEQENDCNILIIKI